jgi:hypothetical protein
LALPRGGVGFRRSSTGGRSDLLIVGERKAVIAESGFGAGPWVLVLGMHRSGTSAVAGALAALGLSLPAPDDLMTGRPDNPVHYESRALAEVNDALLAALGGTWSAPPDLRAGWERTQAVQDVESQARRAARVAFPDEGPRVWKDPRLCLVLPYWRRRLVAPVGTILVWRAPLAVARSLRTRQAFTLSHGLALWDRYNRAALATLSGHPALVISYEDLLADAARAMRAAASWLSRIGCMPAQPDDTTVAKAAATVAAGLARHDDDGEVPAVVEEMTTTLRGLSGVHEHLPAVSVPPPPPWMADTFVQRRDFEQLYARYLRYAKWRRRLPFGRGGRTDAMSTTRRGTTGSA